MSTNYKRLKGNQRVYFNATIIQHRMCGTREVSQDKDGVITLVYETGSTESALLPEVQLSEQENLFTVVRMVQMARSKIVL